MNVRECRKTKIHQHAKKWITTPDQEEGIGHCMNSLLSEITKHKEDPKKYA